MSAFLKILKSFQVITIKLRRFRLRKCYFWVLAVKYKQSGLSRIADTVLDCKYSVKYENVIIGATKRNMSDLELRGGKAKVGKQGVRSLYLFEITK